ncbi:MAG: DUF4445 domain-containing protein, partial [Actinobacteria bacterium]|nr:DUF4445 domain-containing protein [Actinomycetota bacterium]
MAAAARPDDGAVLLARPDRGRAGDVPLPVQEPPRRVHRGVRLPQPAPARDGGRSAALPRRRQARLPGRVGDGLTSGRRTLFDDADAIELRVPTSCRRSGRCRECVVEVVAGADALGPRTAPEAFLQGPYRLACQAEVRHVEAQVEMRVVRRRLRILSAPPEPWSAPIDSPARVSAGEVVYDGESLGPYRGALLGLAIDLGTTTIVLELVDLESGEVLEVVTLENPQRFGGSDVMSRISYDGGPHHGELRRAARKALNEELQEVYDRRGLDRRAVVEAIVVGNSTMRDLFFDVDVQPIGERPYRSVTEHELRAGARPSTALTRLAHELGLRMNPRGRVVSPPLVASH